MKLAEKALTLRPMTSLASSRGVLIAGIVYFVVGRVFAWPTAHVPAWRLAAWLVSGIVFALHIGYERIKVQHSPRSTAFNTAVAVGVGAFLLAVAGMINAMASRSSIQATWYLALVAWPVFTAIPAFLVALIAATVHSRLRKSSVDAGTGVRRNEEL